MKIKRTLLRTKVAESLAAKASDPVLFDLADGVTKAYVSSLCQRVIESTGQGLDGLKKWAPAEWADALVGGLVPVAEGSDEVEIDSEPDVVEQIAADSSAMADLMQKEEAADILADTPQADEPVDEDTYITDSTSTGEFKFIEEPDNTPWGDIDQVALKARLRDAKEKGVPNVDDVIRDVYAIADPNNPATWQYPHHTIADNGEVRVNTHGLNAAVNSLVARYSGSQSDKLAAAGTLLAHTSDHPVLSAVTEAKPGLHMVTLEILRSDESVLTLDSATSDVGMKMCVAESAANVLRDTGVLAIDRPTVLQIDESQLDAVHTNLTGISRILMGEADVAPVKESVQPVIPDTTELDDLKDKLALAIAKVDALQDLLSTSPLKGVAESIAAADSLDSAMAFKRVAETVGIKRLITARRTPAGIADATKKNVTESGGDFDELSALIDKPNNTGDETPAPPRKSLAMFV